MPTTSLWNCVWITGASTGIGRELALRVAATGAKVAISARSEEKLRAVAAEHPNITAYPLDVTSRDATIQVVRQITDAMGPIDLAVLNAGLWQPMKAREFDSQTCVQSMEVNYSGVTHGIDAVLDTMLERGAGHIAIVASIAGYRGLPNASAYAPSKAALIALSETLYQELTPLGLKISVVNPGFVETPMTRVNRFPMPFLITAEDAAQHILKGLQRDKYEIAFPWQLTSVLSLARIMPNWLFFIFARWFLTPSGGGKGD